MVNLVEWWPGPVQMADLAAHMARNSSSCCCHCGASRRWWMLSDSIMQRVASVVVAHGFALKADSAQRDTTSLSLSLFLFD